MCIIVNIDELNSKCNKDQIECICNNCGIVQLRNVYNVRTAISRGYQKFLCKSCVKLTKISTKVHKSCINCNKIFTVSINSLQCFCCQSCSAAYNNTHKKYGIRRSKLEIWVEQELIKLYPNMDFHFNRKSLINSELDIYIPTIKTAFELNGIYHYKPIHSDHQFARIKDNDNKKVQACLALGVDIHIINTSSQRFFDISSSKLFLDEICNIINMKIGCLART